ncbi:MAG: cupin domain-containing protein [Acetobacteraceae bacterium]|nr:cupin domain-containing protein [Acetobacteraceae bacterium]
MAAPLVRWSELAMWEGHPLALTGWLEADQAELTVLHRRRNGSFKPTRHRFCAARRSLKPTGAFACVRVEDQKEKTRNWEIELAAATVPEPLSQRTTAGSSHKVTRSAMKRDLTFLSVLLNLLFWLIPIGWCAGEPPIKVEKVLQATQAWDGSPYSRYPAGPPQLTVLRITIPPHTALHWHHHPVISVAYVLAGHLTVEKRETGERTVVQPGQAVAETVDLTHRGFTTDEPVELIVFYAGQVGVPLTINEE